MTTEYSDFDLRKNSLIREMFQDTADETYVVARWCYFNALMIPFYWNGLHAVEKYLKAVLLLNGQSSIRGPEGTFSHNIERLYEAVQRLAGDFLPEDLTKPAEFDEQFWRHESLAVFVQRLNCLGDPNNRYNIFGYAQFPEDLHKLDDLVRCVRRLAVPLACNAFLGSHREDSGALVTNAELLSEFPTALGLSRRLAKLTDKSAPAATRFAGLEKNFAFAPAGYEHDKSQRYKTSSHRPVLYRYIIEPAKKSEANDAVAADLGDWVLDNIFLPVAAKKEIKDAVKALREGRPL